MQVFLRPIDLFIQVTDLIEPFLEEHGHNPLGSFDFAHTLIAQVHTRSLNIDTGLNTLIGDGLSDLLLGDHLFFTIRVEQVIALTHGLINGEKEMPGHPSLIQHIIDCAGVSHRML